jgi:putative spermidine/putrescine transport system substrate-binding protein
MALTAFGTPAQAEETVVFAGWGGSIQKAQRQVFFDSFQKATGIRVIDVPDVQITKIKAMVEAGNVQWDLVEAIGPWVPAGDKANLWEPLDYTVIDKGSVLSGLALRSGIGMATFAIIQAINKDAFGSKPPRSWALIADGVAPDHLYPLDVDRAFRSLDKIKPEIHVWWKQWPQGPALLSSGELAASITSSTRITSARKADGTPLEVVWNGGLMTVDMLAVPRGAPHKEAAMKLAAWMLDAKRQAEIAHTASVGPSNPKALDSLTAEEKEDLPLYHLQKGELIRFGDAWWADNEEAVTQRWNAWKLQ